MNTRNSDAALAAFYAAEAAAQQAQETLDGLCNRRAPDLFAALAQRVSDTAISDSNRGFGAAIEVGAFTLNNETVALGRRIFHRWNKTLHQFVCEPDSNDDAVRTKLISALTGREGGVAVVAAALVTTFGANMGVAAIVAALLMRLFLQPAGEELCATWKKHLSEGDRALNNL